MISTSLMNSNYHLGSMRNRNTMIGTIPPTLPSWVDYIKLIEQGLFYEP
jgi:hypothetical protein